LIYDRKIVLFLSLATESEIIETLGPEETTATTSVPGTATAESSM